MCSVPKAEWLDWTGSVYYPFSAILWDISQKPPVSADHLVGQELEIFRLNKEIASLSADSLFTNLKKKVYSNTKIDIVQIIVYQQIMW